MIEIGKSIPAELASYLNARVTTGDRADVADKTEISASLLQKLQYRQTSVTENNKAGLVALIQRAIDNCVRDENAAISDKEMFERSLS